MGKTENYQVGHSTNGVSELTKLEKITGLIMSIKCKVESQGSAISNIGGMLGCNIKCEGGNDGSPTPTKLTLDGIIIHLMDVYSSIEANSYDLYGIKDYL